MEYYVITINGYRKVISGTHTKAGWWTAASGGTYVNVDGAASVSYTHLDVYKRQGLYIRISFFLENAFICHWCMYCRNGSDRRCV